MHRMLLLALCLLLVLPALAYPRTVEFRSLNEEPIAGAKLYYREFTGRIDRVYFGPTGYTEEVMTTDARGEVQIDKAISERMPSAFGSDYALLIAAGYTPQLVSLGNLQNRIYLRPLEYHQLTLVLPDGTPAAGATFAAVSEGGKIHQLNNAFSGITTPYFRVTADQHGIARLPCIRTATTKDGECGVSITGVAFTNGFVNEAVTVQGIGPTQSVVTLNKAQQVRGVVTDTKGRPIAGAIIRCAEFLLPSTHTDQQGNFLYNILPTAVPSQQVAGRTVEGTLTLYIDAPGCARQGISLAPTSVKTDAYRLVLEPLVTVSGKLLDRASGQPVVNSRKYGYYIRVRHALGPYSEGRTGSTMLVTNQDGTFTAQIPRQACLEVTDSMAIREPFTPGDYREGDVITLQAVSR